MPIREKENAKIWQLDASNKQATKQANDESDSDLENGTAGLSTGLLNNRFAAIAAAPTKPRIGDRPPNRSPKPNSKTPGRTVPPSPKPQLLPVHTRPTPGPHRLPVGQTTAYPTSAIRKEPAKKITFSTKKDNASKTAFRKGKLQDATFTLSKESDKIEPDRSKMYARLEEIGVRFGSFVRPPQYLKDRTLLVWGDKKQVGQTILELKDWDSLADSDRRGARETILAQASRDKFAKTGENVEKRERELDKKLKRAAAMQQFQKDPADGQQFEYQAYFLWPSDEVNSEDLLGSNCEAFDPIRTYMHSHIVWEPQLSGFKILSNNELAVQHAIKRIEGTMREYAARSSTTYAFNVVHFPEASNMLQDVKTLSGSPLSGSIKASLIPVLTGEALIGDALTTFQTDREELVAGNKRKMQRSLSKIIGRLPAFRGRLRMRVYFGIFTLDTIQWPGGAPTIPYSKFASSVVNPATSTGTVVRDLQFQDIPEALISRCTGALGCFEPSSNRYGEDDGITPIYTGRFKFRSNDTGSVTLEVELKKPSGEGAIYEVSRSQWTRDDRAETSSPYDVNVVQPTGGCSWKLQIAHETNVDETRITPRMADFAGSVNYKDPPGDIRPEITGCKVFKHAFNLQYESFEQKTAIQFQHKDNSAWIFEFARYDTFSPNISTASSKAQWGASLWNTEWDTILAENDNLGIGVAAKWEAKLDKFFQGDSQTIDLGVDGFQDFLHKVQEVTTLLDDMKGLTRHQ